MLVLIKDRLAGRQTILPVGWFMVQKTVDLGDGYAICATRKQVGAFQVVGVDWEHPNYGYFTDAMVWINSPHMGRWQPLSVVGWSRKYRQRRSSFGTTRTSPHYLR